MKRQDIYPGRASAVLQAIENGDTAMMTAANREARALQKLAREKGLDLAGDQSIAPALLDPHATRLVEIFNPLSFTPAYLARQERCDIFLADDLCASDHFRDMCARWPTLEGKPLQGRLSWLSSRQQFHFGRDAIPVRHVNVTTYETPRAPGPDGRLTLAWHSPARDENHPAFIGINTHRDTGFQDFFKGMKTLYHENRHAVQWMLGRTWQEKDITRDHPLAREACLFSLYFMDKTSYIPAVYPVYRAYPLEQDAFAGADRFMDILRDRMAHHKIKPAAMG